MKNVKSLADYLGEPYTVKTIDQEPVVYRALENGYSFEISGAFRKNGPYTVYVWPPQGQIEIIYEGIQDRLLLKDLMGHLAIRVQNRRDQYRVERE